MRNNTYTYNIQPLDLDINRLTGLDTMRVMHIGTDAIGAPSGTITFTAPDGWTVNGGAGPVVFSGFDGPAEFVLHYRVVALDVVVRLTRAHARTGNATYDPPSIAAGEQETTTVTVTGAALGDFAATSFSLDLQGITLSAYVSAADTVTCVFFNGTADALDLASGTLRARVVKVQAE